MTKNVLKISLLLIAAAMFVSIAFAGAASAADTKIIDNEADYISNFSVSELNTDTTYYIHNKGDWVIPSLHNGTNTLTISKKVIMDFTNVTDHRKFAGVASGNGNSGGIFGSIKITDGGSLDIVGLNMSSVNVASSYGMYLGGIIGAIIIQSSGTGNINIIDSHLQNCSVVKTNYGNTGAIIGGSQTQSYNFILNVKCVDCSIDGCSVTCTGESDSATGGIIGKYDPTQEFQCLNCSTVNSTIEGNGYGGTGGLGGYINQLVEENCMVENCTILSTNKKVGGFGGHVGTVKSCVNSTVVKSIISGNTNVGGGFGDIFNFERVENITVDSCFISSGALCGGLIGNAELPDPKYGIKNFNFVGNKVINSIIDCDASIGNVGGVFGLIFCPNAGGTSELSNINYEACHIDNCTIITGDTLGGMIGETYWLNYTFKQYNWENNSALFTGGLNSVGKIIGKNNSEVKVDSDPNVIIQNIWLKDSSSEYPKLVISDKDTVVPIGAKLVTKLSGYGAGGKNYAIAYVFEAAPPVITNSTSANGTVIVSKPAAYAGDTIHVVAINSIGYHFVDWNVTNSTGKIPVDSKGNFTMPNSTVNAGANFTANVTTLVFHNDAATEEKLNTYNLSTNFTATPSKPGYTFDCWRVGSTGLDLNSSTYVSDDGKWIYTGDDGETLDVYANWTANPTPYTPSHKESGQTVIQQQAPVQDVSKDPTPANQATADITVKYVGQSVLGTSTSDSAALKEQYPEAAAQVELSFAMAQEAGIPLTNSKGAKAVVVTDQNIPNVEKVTFSRVYEISPANAGEKLTKVTVKVPKTDVTSKGLTSEDVTVYHYLESYKIWVPLETISMTQDADNYYYTAATDGTSPFGVLVKKFGETTAPTTQPTQTQKSPAPLAGIIIGLGAAAILMRMRR